jgi:hypothetical protein
LGNVQTQTLDSVLTVAPPTLAPPRRDAIFFRFVAFFDGLEESGEPKTSHPARAGRRDLALDFFPPIR